MQTRRWQVLIFFALAMMALICDTPKLAAYMNRQRLVETYLSASSLACEGVVGKGKTLRHILVFQSVFQGWPGENHQDIVVTDAAYDVVGVHATDHKSMFVTAGFSALDGRQLLTVRRSIRPGFQAEVVTYEYVEGRICEVSRVIDPPVIAIPPNMKLSRRGDVGGRSEK